ncbi:hypothetical protein GW813_07350 [bacterium]|nr:hypothetical protein [bacterium]
MKALRPRRLGSALGILILAASFAVPGIVVAADTDIVITEIMQNPLVLADTAGEWFEVHNTGAADVDMEGWTIKDNDTESHVITTGGTVIVPAGGYAVLARDAVTMAGEGVTAVYQYSGFQLANAADEIVLLNASLVEIDRVEYDGGPLWPDPNGASMMFDEVSPDNNVGTAWSTSVVTFGSGDAGTPGAANGSVPLQAPHITDVYHRPLLPVPDETVTIQATVTDADGTLSAVTMHYSYNMGSWLTQAMSLFSGDIYTTDLPGGVDGDQLDYYVTATDNDAQTSSNPSDAPTSYYTYFVANEAITPIATIHADSAGSAGSLLMVQGQVYVPGDYKADGTSVSAYIQDGSGRGMNIFGTTRSTGMTLLNSTGNIVKISGYVSYYGTTLELVNYEVELLSNGNTPLTPTVLTTAAAAALSNEGTYIKATGPITAIATTTGTNPAHNFTIDDGSGPVVVRIDDDTIVGMDGWLVGDELVAAGAGGSYAGAGQILVGLASDVANNGQGPDVTAPTLVSALLGTPTTVLVTFDEAVDPVTAAVAGNYQVYETAAPGNTIAVNSAVVQVNGVSVLLTLAASGSGVDHTLQVNNVKDTSNNSIAPGSTIAIIEVGNGDIVINEIMQNPYVLNDAVGEWFEVYNQGSGSVDMNGWTIKDAGLDSHVINNGGPLIIGPGEYKVFVRNAATMTLEGVTPFYEYSSLTLGNGDDELVLLDTTQAQIDSVAWDGGILWPDPTGSSMQFVVPGDNNNGANWAQNGPVFGSGDRGTPGAPNNYLSPVPELPIEATSLKPNFPNPFNPNTTFDFALVQDSHVLLRVFDVRGRLIDTVVDADLPRGYYNGDYSWDGKDNRGRTVTSGTYFYRLETNNGFIDTGKMLLVK